MRARDLAPRLLGALLVSEHEDGVTAGRIVEVEAYEGPHDLAAHTAGGRRTPRNEVMWGEPGRAYVYFVYGMHWCFNVVAHAVGKPEAVLIRALEPVVGVDLMRRRRTLPSGRDRDLSRGPARLCRALAIGRDDNGRDLHQGRITVRRGDPDDPPKILVSPRVGIDYAGEDTLLPWRFLDETRSPCWSDAKQNAAATAFRQRPSR